MPYYDGNFSSARELEGSGIREFSEFNTADFILTRFFAQDAATYKPLPLSAKDAVYKNAFMVKEFETRRSGGLVYYTRIFATVPSSRSERQEVAFTFPGKSSLVTTTVNGEPVRRWDRYGRARPSTVFREALVQYSYSIGAPTTGLPTQISYDGQPVDFVGRVYSEDGSDYLGSTSPLTEPGTFVMSDVARIWRGDIWERTRISVSRSTGGSPIPL